MIPFIRTWCKNKDCSAHDQKQIIQAGRIVAPGVMEKHGTLTCMECGHDMWVEPAA